jgi:Fe-S oxidoreductase
MDCPACALIMREDYPRFGVRLQPEIVHVTELLAPAVDRLPITRRRRRALYHDPCYLGRHLGLYEPPRVLARAAVGELLEFSRARGEAACAGGGGLLPVTMPATAAAIAAERVVEAKEASIDTIVTACATCERQLSREGITAIDLIALLDEATAPPPG